MNILVTGSNGMVGREICKRLHDFGTLISFDCAGSYEDWDSEFALLKKQMLSPDLIVHCGALMPNVDGNPKGNLLWEMNYSATKKLAEYAQDVESKFLFFSSWKAIKPVTEYGWTKKVAEDILQLILPEKNLCVLRPSNIWSWDEVGKRAPSIIHKILTRKLDSVYKGCVRDFVCVSDVAKVVPLLAKDWRAGTFEVGTGVPVDIEELVRGIYKHLDLELPQITKHELPDNCHVVNPDNFPPGWHPSADHVLNIMNLMASHIDYQQRKIQDEELDYQQRNQTLNFPTR